MPCGVFFFFSSRRRHTRCSRDWSSDVCSSDLDAPFTAAVRMIHGVHRYAADRGPDAPPTRAPGLSEGFILMVEIAHLANRGHAIHGKFANFAGRQLYESDLAFLAQQLRRAACRTNDLSAAPGVELEVVH